MSEPVIRKFRVAVYRWNADPAVDDPVTSTSGTDDWRGATHLDAPGFSTTCSVDLQPVWEEILARRLTRYDGRVNGFEVIAKFGTTMDWSTPFRLIVDVEYA